MNDRYEIYKDFIANKNNLFLLSTVDLTVQIIEAVDTLILEDKITAKIEEFKQKRDELKQKRDEPCQTIH